MADYSIITKTIQKGPIEKLKKKSITWLQEEPALPSSFNPGKQGNDSEVGVPLEEGEKDPICFPIFSWSLILVGFSMLVTVVVIMGQLVLDWTQGNLSQVTRKNITNEIVTKCT